MFPQGKFAKFKKYSGHSAHVTNVQWTFDKQKLVSLGGADTAVMIWRREGNQADQGQSDDSDTDDEEEGKFNNLLFVCSQNFIS